MFPKERLVSALAAGCLNCNQGFPPRGALKQINNILNFSISDYASKTSGKNLISPTLNVMKNAFPASAKIVVACNKNYKFCKSFWKKNLV